MGNDERTWRIGDVATATGLTVRALHHYDQIGLVVPSERSGSGHRLYSDPDLRKLYMVTALRQLGLSLEQVGRVLSADLEVRDVIDEQLAQVERQIRMATRLREQLLAARDAGGGEGGGSAGNAEGGGSAASADTMPGLMAVIKLMQDMRGYLNPEQIQAMHRRLTDHGVVAEHAVGVEMPALYQDALREMLAGTPVSDPAVRRVVDRLDELTHLLRGPDEAIGAAFRRMWLDRGRREPGRDGAEHWGELVGYLDEARALR